MGYNIFANRVAAVHFGVVVTRYKMDLQIDNSERRASVSQKLAENSIFRTRFREGLPRFSITTLEATLWKKRRVGFIELPNGVDIEYRRKHRNKLIYLRIMGVNGQWRCIELSRLRSNKKARRIVCPYCTSAVHVIYAINASRGGWRCDRCIQKPSALPSKEARRLLNQLKEGNLQPVAESLSDRSSPSMIGNAMIAMQMAGLRPKQFTVSRHPTIKIRVNKRLRLRSNGQLIYVGGRLHVR